MSDRYAALPDLNRIADPKIFGPGKWDSLNIRAAFLGMIGKDDLFIFEVRLDVATLPCGTCKSHATDYIKKYPPEAMKGYNVEGYGPKFAMLYWLVGFHNNASKISGKTQYRFEDIYKFIMPRVQAVINQSEKGEFCNSCLDSNSEAKNNDLKDAVEVTKARGTFKIIARK